MTITSRAIVPENPADLGFDAERFPAWRPGQHAIIQKIVDWYCDSPTKYLFLEAPTGVGKSIIVSAACLTLLKHYGPNWWSVITTTTLNLQRQYMEETLAGKAKSAWGRGNYLCAVLDNRASAAEGPCTHGFTCPIKSTCQYYVERDSAHAANIAVLNTAFYLTCINYANMPNYLDNDNRPAYNLYTGVSLAIHDEAHLLERAVMNFVEVTLNARFFRELGMPLPNVAEYGSWDEFIQEAIPAVRPLADEYISEAKRMGPAGELPDDPTGKQAVAQLAALERLAKDILPTRPLIENKETHTTFRPIWGKDFAFDVLFKHAYKHLMMSATIINPQFIAETLGIAEGEYTYIPMPSPFAPMRRRVVYDPQGAITYKTTREAFAKVVAYMDDIIDKSHADQKGIIHSVSYDRARWIIEYSRHRARMVTHQQGRGEKELAIERFLAAPAGAILVSPSVGVGEDFGRGDNCRHQWFLKYPVPFMGDPVVKARSEENKESIWFEADMAFVQSIGRGMRSMDDFCTNYVLDSKAGFRLGKLPQWIQDSIIDMRRR